MDNGGNSLFVDTPTVEAWQESIARLIADEDAYAQMQKAAREKTEIYLYSNIARKSLADVGKA